MTEVVLVRHIAARPSIVFDALTTCEGMTSWWGPEDAPVTSAVADVRPGGAFRVTFPCFDELEHVVTGEFLEVVKPTRLVLSWRWAQRGEPEEQGATSRVEFRLRSTETGTEPDPGADDRLSLARTLLHPREVAALEATAPAGRRTRFLEIWTLKEAYVKARGLGLSLSLRDFAFTTSSGRAPGIHFDPGFEDSRSGWRFFQLRPTGLHRGALAVRRAGHEAWRVTQIFVDLLNTQPRGCLRPSLQQSEERLPGLRRA
jgi:uncharacterized protein YndB with AHSA1/START domain